MVCFLGSDTDVRLLLLMGDGFANQYSSFSRLCVKQIRPAPICHVLCYSSIVLLTLSTWKASFIPAVSFSISPSHNFSYFNSDLQLKKFQLY